MNISDKLYLIRGLISCLIRNKHESCDAIKVVISGCIKMFNQVKTRFLIGRYHLANERFKLTWKHIDLEPSRSTLKYHYSFGNVIFNLETSRSL